MDLEKTNGSRLVGCVTALHSFAQIRPQLLVEHAISMEPYLNIKCSSNEQIKFISLLAEILEHVRAKFKVECFGNWRSSLSGCTFDGASRWSLPLRARSSSHDADCVFAANRRGQQCRLPWLRHQQDHKKLSARQRMLFKVSLISLEFNETKIVFLHRIYSRALVHSKDLLMKNPNVSTEQIYNPVFRRGIFTVGLLMRYFDFSRPDVNGSNTNERSKWRKENRCVRSLNHFLIRFRSLVAKHLWWSVRHIVLLPQQQHTAAAAWNSTSSRLLLRHQLRVFNASGDQRLLQLSAWSHLWSEWSEDYGAEECFALSHGRGEQDDTKW